jgi:hypothetical protein
MLGEGKQAESPPGIPDTASSSTGPDGMTVLWNGEGEVVAECVFLPLQWVP